MNGIQIALLLLFELSYQILSVCNFSLGIAGLFPQIFDLDSHVCNFLLDVL
jgi:hypothetical protein